MSEWISVEDMLPPEGKPVLVHRLGGKNDHRDVEFGQRDEDSREPDGWKWVTCSGGLYAYMGISADGSVITHWMLLPDVPELESRDGRVAR